jgi:O-succinylbenzoic acid--CoA ligase
VRAAIGPDVALRLDANGALPVERAREILAALEAVRPDWIEEPVPLAMIDAVLPSPVPIAIDESLVAAPGAIDDALARMRRGEVAALILKPTMLGGRLRCAELAAAAQAAGGRSAASHCFEGPIAQPPTLPSPLRGEGIALHAAMGVASPSPRRGEGQGGGLALIDGIRRWSWEEIEARVAIERRALWRQGARLGVPFPVVAVHRMETAVRLFALWELGAVALLLDPDGDDHAERTRDAAQLRSREAGAIVFTSGSTGRPRPVLLPWSALAASAAASAANLGWRDDDRWLCCLPLHHVGGLSILVRTRIARRTAVLAPPGSDGAAIARLIADARITLASLVPAQLARLADDLSWLPPPHLRAILVGGAAAAPSLLRRALDRGLPVLRTYGMTETASQICTDPPGAAPDLDAGIPPLPGVTLAIDDAGRIRVRGPMVCAPGPDGWLTTTDLGELDARGALRVRGRADDVIVTGGEKIDPLEVEAALLELPGIEAACVFGVPDPQWGQLVAAALVGDRLDPGDDAALRAALAARLSGARRPRRICRLPALALGPGGKLDRRATARAAAPLLRPL